MSALRETQALNGAAHLDWWPGQGGRTWEIEWQGGPFPAEVAQKLMQAADAGDWGAHALCGMVVRDQPRSAHRAHLIVFDIPVTLRALDPIGEDEVWRRLTPVAAG
jgi:hypothetical protein